MTVCRNRSDTYGAVYVITPGDPASVITLEGQGGYDGLYAVLDCGTVRMPEDGSDPPACEGYLFEGEPPQLPAPMPAE